ncbi:MAG: ROK family protein [Cyanobacteria bacterium J06607_13]
MQSTKVETPSKRKADAPEGQPIKAEASPSTTSVNTDSADKLAASGAASVHNSAHDSVHNQRQLKPVKTLAIDIGGSGVKALLLNAQGEPLSDRDRIKTPKPATPSAVMAILEQLATHQTDFDRISVGFPGVVSHGVVHTAVNLHPSWQGYDLASQLSEKLGKPVRVANDADLQGMGAISGQGVELVITLGTGFGTALFTDGHLVPNIELAHHRFRKGQTYEEQLGRAALKKVGHKTWNARLLKAIESLSRTLNYDHLYIGGGEAKQIDVDLPKNVTLVSNMLGLLGGINLWKD